MMSIKFITILLVLAFTSEAWGFKCGTAGKTNGVCATKKRKVFKSVTDATANGDELNCTTGASFCCDKKRQLYPKNGQANVLSPSYSNINPTTPHRTPNNNNHRSRMAQESEPAPICEALRSFLTNLRIETAEAFFAGDEKSKPSTTPHQPISSITISRIFFDRNQKAALQLGPEVLDSDEDWRRRVLALFHTDQLETFRPFIETIFANEATSDEEMLSLIPEIPTEPSTPTPVTSPTPLRTGTTSGHINPSTKLTDCLPTLRRELNELLYTEVPGLMEHFLDARHIDPTHRKRSYKDFIEKKAAFYDEVHLFVRRTVDQPTRPEIPMSRIWRTQPNTRLEGVEGTRRVDGAIMSKVNTNEETYHIRDVLVPFELKKDKEEVNKAVICLGRYVCEVFKAQPTRRFVVGVTVFETSIQIWQFDRKLLGFDPTFLEAHDLPTVIRIQTRDDQEFEIDPKPVFRASGITGRAPPAGKRIFLEIESGILIKDSWQPEHRRKEGDMLRIVTEKNVHHVARYHYHENSEDLNPPNRFINRFHRRLILKDVGEPIWEVGSPLRLLEAIEGCIIGHQGLYEAGYLHRDISINNLMVNDQAVDRHYRSFLIDLDVAIPNSASKDDVSHARTGTKVFMSVGLLRGVNPHTYADDIESFFWVLVWICIHHPKDQRKDVSRFALWNQQGPWELAGIKNEFLLFPQRLVEAVRGTLPSSTQNYPTGSRKLRTGGELSPSFKHCIHLTVPGEIHLLRPY
ncbi:hypothetical protein H4Q26_000754 [Puccinia striiformis f. sp. tritici PST-130]|nr:hypothetical protein H4Q26_000754 [Puccinia striiformis f. sp. tritici PST-130]